MPLALKLPKKSKAKKPKARPFKASRNSKFVLFLGDEGAILVHIIANVVQSRQFVPDAAAQNLIELRQTLERDPDAPLLMVVDTMDQTYVQQTLPPVSSMSVGKLVKRRLDRDFGSNDIKGVIILGREQSGRKDWNFLMIAIEKSPQISSWLEFIGELSNRFKGIYLVSAETENIVRQLDLVVPNPPEASEAQWKFFVSHNKVGGFRQVILHRGKLVLTRLAQPIGDSNAEMIAGNIEQEMLSTIEYMKRLSYNPQDGLDIYILAASSISSAIDRKKFSSNRMEVITPYEMAEHFGIEGATQPTDQFGDVILAAIIGCSRKHVLKLTTALSKKFDKYYGLLWQLRGAAVAVGLGLLGYAGSVGLDIYDVNSHLEELQADMKKAQTGLDFVKQDVGRSKIDVEKGSDMIDLYEQLQKEKFSLLPTLDRLRSLSLQQVKIKGVEWSSVDDKNPAAKKQITLTLQFPPAADNVKVFREIFRNAMENIKSVFPPPFEIVAGDLPRKYRGDEPVSFEFGTVGAANSQASDSGNAADVKVMIRGDAIMPIAEKPVAGKGNS